MRRSLCFLIFMLGIFHVQAGFADRGSIPFNPHVKVFEPTQKALIAWNGKEELLLLSTELRSSEPTRVLEVIPFPSEPTVKEGNERIFERAINLINKRMRMKAYWGRGLSMEGEPPPAGEVTFHDRIGSHDISVTHVLDSNGFVEWVEGYLTSADVENPTLPEVMKSVVDEYLQEGFQWFVFDVVSLDETLRIHDALQYRFFTESLFYPLKITRTEEGHTSIELLILTPWLVGDFAGIPMADIQLLHDPIALSAGELRSLSEEMDDLLGHQDGMKLRIWQIKGELSSFERDLIAR